MGAYGSIHVRIPKQGTNTCVSSREETGKGEPMGVVPQTLFSAFCSISHALAPVSSDWKNWDIPQLEHTFKTCSEALYSIKMSPCCLRAICFPGTIIHSHNKLLVVPFKAPSKLVGLFFPCCFQSF